MKAQRLFFLFVGGWGGGSQGSESPSMSDKQHFVNYPKLFFQKFYFTLSENQAQKQINTPTQGTSPSIFSL